MKTIRRLHPIAAIDSPHQLGLVTDQALEQGIASSIPPTCMVEQSLCNLNARMLALGVQPRYVQKREVSDSV